MGRIYKLKSCYDCKQPIRKGGECNCPILPIILRFWYQSKRHKAFAITDIKHVMDKGHLRLFIIAGKAVIEDLEDVEAGRKEGESGFDALLDKFNL